MFGRRLAVATFITYVVTIVQLVAAINLLFSNSFAYDNTRHTSMLLH